MPFCKYCGKQLKDGEECTCERARSAKNDVEMELPVQVEDEKKGNSIEKTELVMEVTNEENGKYDAKHETDQQNHKEILQKSFEILKGTCKQLVLCWKAPNCHGSGLVEKGDHIYAIILIMVHALLSGFLSLVQVEKVGKTINALVSPVYSLAETFGINVNKIELPVSKAFWCSLFCSLAISGLITILLALALYIVKSKAEIKQMICITSLRSIAAIPFTIIAILFTFINQSVGLAINAVALIFSYTFMLQGIKGVTDIEENKKIYIVAIVNTVTLFVAMFIAEVVLKEAAGELIEGIKSSLF